ncbi:MAG: STAS domain-containing protein [Akkermansiaceae bacterium]|nr:STAS domain-containing protein [Akkermansiaceae bacterium]
MSRQPPWPSWLRAYKLPWLRADLIAGFTLAAYMIPASIGDASLAGLPPQAGLYSCVFAGLVFWLFTTSRLTAVTVTSAISLLVGSSLAPLAGGDPARLGELAAATALMVAVITAIIRLSRAGGIVNFISEPVLVGFKLGVGIFLATTQLPKLCGFAGSHGDFPAQAAHFAGHLGSVHPLSAAIGLTALLLLFAARRFFPHKPLALPVVILGLLSGFFIDPGQLGVHTLGGFHQALPALGVPTGLGWADLRALLPLAAACVLLGTVETTAVGRVLARKHAVEFKGPRQFVALAAANLAVGLAHGYPVSGGMSQSLVNEEGGARTPLSGLIAALFILVLTVTSAASLRSLPLPVLAAVVIFAITGLFESGDLKRLWRFSRAEFAVAMIALLGVLVSGILPGVFIGSIMSLLLLLHRSAIPHSTELGRIPGSIYFADHLRNPENARIPGVFIFRVDGALLYFNVDYVRERFFELLDQRGEPLELVILHFGSVTAVDLAAVDLLVHLRHTLLRRHVHLRIAEAHTAVRIALQRSGFVNRYGPVDADLTVEAVLERWKLERES